MPDYVLRVNTLKHSELLEQLPVPRWSDLLRAADRRPRDLPTSGKFEFGNPTEDRKKAVREGGTLARRLTDRTYSATVVALVHWDNVEAQETGEDLPDLYQAVVQVSKRS